MLGARAIFWNCPAPSFFFNKSASAERRAGACPLPAVGVVKGSRGTGPRATAKEESPFKRRAGACPLPVVGVVEWLRGTGPRATAKTEAPHSTVGQGPVPCQLSGSSSGCEGQALALR